MNYKSAFTALLLSIALLGGCAEPERAKLSEEEKRIKGREAAIMLIKSLGDSNSDVQFIAVENLVMIGDPAVEPLLEAIVSENPFVRRRAADALGRLRDKRAVEPLIMTLNDKMASVRISASFALGLLEDERAVGPLVRLLNDERDNVSKMAMMSLGQITKLKLGIERESKQKWIDWYVDSEKAKSEVQ